MEQSRRRLTAAPVPILKFLLQKDFQDAIVWGCRSDGENPF